MAAGLIRNFFIQAPTPAYFPLIFQPSPGQEGEDELLEEQEVRQAEVREEDDEEEEEEDEECEAQEEEECVEETHLALDVTQQLLRFAELISQDVQRYFGRGSSDQDACEGSGAAPRVPASGRLRYYDDLLRLARAGAPGEPEGPGCTDLGPLAELFQPRGPGQGRGRPMTKRLLPLSFWSEPRGPLEQGPSGPEHTHSGPHMQGGPIPLPLAQHGGLDSSQPGGLDSSQPDFSDLLANWEPQPELPHTDGHTHAAQSAATDWR